MILCGVHLPDPYRDSRTYATEAYPDQKGLLGTIRGHEGAHLGLLGPIRPYWGAEAPLDEPPASSILRLLR